MTFRRCRILALFAAAALAACGDAEPPVPGGTPMQRRLTESQYRTVIADVFGSGIVVGGRFDPLRRSEGLAAAGAASAVMTPSGFEQYDLMARSIAAQVMSPARRPALVPCAPAAQSARDDACAAQFMTDVGRLLFRRPLTEEEIRIWTRAAGDAAETLESFHDGLGVALAGLLVSPEFLFVVDASEPDPAGGRRLTAYAKASRLSFLLWNGAPDAALMEAAARGELHTGAGLARQVDRMLGSPRLERGVRAFFTDLLDLEKAEQIEKDSVLYPTFSIEVARDAKEQVLRTIIDHLITRGGDYRDLFTTRKTFMSGPLGRIYQVPVARPDGGWFAHEFAADDPRAGLLMQIGFAALHAHPGRSSATLRGRAIREELLCQKVPDPPGDVDFSLFNDPNSPNRTARQRLSAHSTAPTCAGCHKLTDPIGLALENVDADGALRQAEQGEAIDPAGDFDGVAFRDAAGLGRALSAHPALPACAVSRLLTYAIGRPPVHGEREYVAYLEMAFADAGYRVPALLKLIATSDAFFAIATEEARS